MLVSGVPQHSVCHAEWPGLHRDADNPGWTARGIQQEVCLWFVHDHYTVIVHDVWSRLWLRHWRRLHKGRCPGPPYVQWQVQEGGQMDASSAPPAGGVWRQVTMQAAERCRVFPDRALITVRIVWLQHSAVMTSVWLVTARFVQRNGRADVLQPKVTLRRCCRSSVTSGNFLWCGRNGEIFHDSTEQSMRRSCHTSITFSHYSLLTLTVLRLLIQCPASCNQKVYHRIDKRLSFETNLKFGPAKALFDNSWYTCLLPWDVFNPHSKAKEPKIHPCLVSVITRSSPISSCTPSDSIAHKPRKLQAKIKITHSAC